MRGRYFEIRPVGWLFWVQRLFETTIYSMSGRHLEKERKKRLREKIYWKKSLKFCKHRRLLSYYHPNLVDSFFTPGFIFL